jgi:hypothetical protein
MACRACGAILLEEMSTEQRESAREAISTRRSISESPASHEARQRETSRPPGAAVAKELSGLRFYMTLPLDEKHMFALGDEAPVIAIK